MGELYISPEAMKDIMEWDKSYSDHKVGRTIDFYLQNILNENNDIFGLGSMNSYFNFNPIVSLPPLPDKKIKSFKIENSWGDPKAEGCFWLTETQLRAVINAPMELLDTVTINSINDYMENLVYPEAALPLPNQEEVKLEPEREAEDRKINFKEFL